MYYVYAISSLTKNYIYVGLSADVQRRIIEHNVGKEKTTRPYLPYELLYVESCEDRLRAREREKYWKSGIGKERLKVIRDSKVLGSTCLPAGRFPPRVRINHKRVEI